MFYKGSRIGLLSHSKASMPSAIDYSHSGGSTPFGKEARSDWDLLEDVRKRHYWLCVAPGRGPAVYPCAGPCRAHDSNQKRKWEAGKQPGDDRCGVGIGWWICISAWMLALKKKDFHCWEDSRLSAANWFLIGSTTTTAGNSQTILPLGKPNG